MSLTIDSLTEYARQRLNLAPAELPRLRTYVDSALSDMARKVVNDYTKRKLLLTDRSTVTSTITSSGSTYYSDLSTIQNTYGVMTDFLAYGTIFYSYAPTFVAGDVSTIGNRITITGNTFHNGDRVQMSNSGGGLPAPFAAATDYYVLIASTHAFQLYTDPDDVSTIVDITTTGSGTQTLTLFPTPNEAVMQWIDVPQFASLDSALPIPYSYCWLLQNRLYINGRTAGTFSYSVPFQPTLAMFNDSDAALTMLENDLIDSLVSIAVHAGLEPATSASI